jgi:uncharacterized membrane protein YgcG
VLSVRDTRTRYTNKIHEQDTRTSTSSHHHSGTKHNISHHFPLLSLSFFKDCVRLHASSSTKKLRTGEIYLRPDQANGLVTLPGKGGTHPVHQLKLFKGSKVLCKIGSVVKEDLVFFRQQVNAMLCYIEEEQRKHKRSEKMKRKVLKEQRKTTSGRNGASSGGGGGGGGSTSFSGRKSSSRTMQSGAQSGNTRPRSLSEAAPTARPVNAANYM